MGPRDPDGPPQDFKYVNTVMELAVPDRSWCAQPFFDLSDCILRPMHVFFAKNGTEWFQTTRSGGTPFSFVREMNKNMHRKGKGKMHLKKH